MTNRQAFDHFRKLGMIAEVLKTPNSQIVFLALTHSAALGRRGFGLSAPL